MKKYKFTEEGYSSINDLVEYKYIARDRSGEVCIFKSKPKKSTRTWLGEYSSVHMSPYLQDTPWDKTLRKIEHPKLPKYFVTEKTAKGIDLTEYSYIAADSNGSLFCYTKRPRLGFKTWRANQDSYTRVRVDEYIYHNDWQYSLMELKDARNLKVETIPFHDELEGYNYVTKDKNGLIYAHGCIPSYDSDEWCSNGLIRRIGFIKISGNWKKSLRRLVMEKDVMDIELLKKALELSEKRVKKVIQECLKKDAKIIKYKARIYELVKSAERKNKLLKGVLSHLNSAKQEIEDF